MMIILIVLILLNTIADSSSSWDYICTYWFNFNIFDELKHMHQNVHFFCKFLICIVFVFVLLFKHLLQNQVIFIIYKQSNGYSESTL